MLKPRHLKPGLVRREKRSTLQGDEDVIDEHEGVVIDTRAVIGALIPFGPKGPVVTAAPRTRRAGRMAFVLQPSKTRENENLKMRRVLGQLSYRPDQQRAHVVHVCCRENGTVGTYHRHICRRNYSTTSSLQSCTAQAAPKSPPGFKPAYIYTQCSSTAWHRHKFEQNAPALLTIWVL